MPRHRGNQKSKIKNQKCHASGFTLIEAALTTVIVGTGVLAIVAAQQAYHMKNDWAQRTGTGMLLANEIRELTLALPLHDPITGDSHLGPEADETTVAEYDDLDDYAGSVDGSGYGSGTTFGGPDADHPGPINALAEQIPDMERWTQHVEVVNVPPNNIASTITYPLGADDPETGAEMNRVTVTVSYQGPNDDSPTTITSLTWVVGEKQF